MNLRLELSSVKDGKPQYSFVDATVTPINLDEFSITWPSESGSGGVGCLVRARAIQALQEGRIISVRVDRQYLLRLVKDEAQKAPQSEIEASK